MSVPLSRVVQFLDEVLSVATVKDESKNGLQVEGGPELRGVRLGVDACLRAAKACKEGDLLLVHHGLFWGAYQPIAGRTKAMVQALLDRRVSLYAAHLPLDMHPEFGNNAALARWMNLKEWSAFGERGLGVIGALTRPTPLKDLARRAFEIGPHRGLVQSFGGRTVRRLAIVSGAGASLLSDAAREGADCLLTGETRHSAYHEAEELKMNVIYAGHYATETLGLRELGKVLSSRFGLTVSFQDLPTGL